MKFGKFLVGYLTPLKCLDAFQKIWGYEDFRAPQGETIRSLLQKQDALVVMPTGGGNLSAFNFPRCCKPD